MPVDGGDATPIGPDPPAPRSGDRDDTACDDTPAVAYLDAVAFGESLYVISDECWECNGGPDLTVWRGGEGPVRPPGGVQWFPTIVATRAGGVVIQFAHYAPDHRGLNLASVSPDGSIEPIGVLYEGDGAWAAGAIGRLPYGSTVTGH